MCPPPVPEPLRVAVWPLSVAKRGQSAWQAEALPQVELPAERTPSKRSGRYLRVRSVGAWKAAPSARTVEERLASGRCGRCAAALPGGKGFRSGPFPGRHPETLRLGRIPPDESSLWSVQRLGTDARRLPGPLSARAFRRASIQVSRGTLKSIRVVGNLVLLCQIEQLLPSLTGQRRRVNHAETVHRKPLFYKEMHQRKGLCVIALVTFVVADVGARPIRRNDLGGPKVPLGKCGFPASRRAAKHDDRRPEEAE